MASLSHGSMVNYYKQECAACRVLVNGIPLHLFAPKWLRESHGCWLSQPAPAHHLPCPILSFTKEHRPGRWTHSPGARGIVPFWSTELYPRSQWDNGRLSSHWHPANRWPPAAFFFNIYLAALDLSCGTWDLWSLFWRAGSSFSARHVRSSSRTRDWTQAPCTGRKEA